MSNNEVLTFQQLLETSPEDYNLMTLKSSDLVTDVYKNVLNFYIHRQISELKDVFTNIEKLSLNPEDKEFLNKVTLLRLKIAQEKLEDFDIQDTDLNLFLDHYRGEYYFVLGLACEKLKKYSEGEDFYQLSAYYLKKSDCPKKALIAIHNKTTCLSKKYPDRNFIPEYQKIYRTAVKSKNRSVVAICIYNIASELKKMGSALVALRYTNRSLLLLEGEMGTYHYEMILLQRCQILCEMQRFEEANCDFALLKKSQHQQIQLGLKVLEELMTHKSVVSDQEKNNLHPSWLERLHLHTVGLVKLSVHEERLIEVLARGPKLRKQLIVSIYGDKIPSQHASNRFKNLLNRLNRKKPGIVVTEGRWLRLV